MTRLAYDLGGWRQRPVHGGPGPDRATRSPKEADTFASARLWDPRPLRTTLDQLQTVRKYYDFTDVDTDRYVIDGVPAPGDAVGPRAGARAEPERDRLGQPADRLHPRRRRRDGPGQRGRQRGPAAAARQQPAAGLRSAVRRPIDPAPDLLRRAARARTSWSGRSRTSSTTRPARATPSGSIGTETRWTGHDRDHARQHADAAALRAALPRPRPADQRPGHRRAASCSSIARSERPAVADRAVPALRQGPVPRHRRQRPDGRTSRTRSRRPTGSRTPRPSTRRATRRDRARQRRRSTTSATASRSRSTPTTGRCTSTSTTRPTRSSGPTRASSRPCSSRSSAMPADLQAHLRVPEELFNVQTKMFGRYHVTDHAAVLRRGRPLDGPEPDERADACRPRPTTSRCGCRASRASSSCSSSRWSRPAGRT